MPTRCLVSSHLRPSQSFTIGDLVPRHLKVGRQRESKASTPCAGASFVHAPETTSAFCLFTDQTRQRRSGRSVPSLKRLVRRIRKFGRSQFSPTIPQARWLTKSDASTVHTKCDTGAAFEKGKRWENWKLPVRMLVGFGEREHISLQAGREVWAASFRSI